MHPIRLTAAVLALALVAWCATPADAQTYAAQQPRRYFVTVSADWIYTYPQDFDRYPLEALVGRKVSTAWGSEPYDYYTADGEILIDVLEFRRRARGAGVTVFPLGSRKGPTLAIRGSVEPLPIIRLGFEGTGAPDEYVLTSARAYDVAAAIHVADRNTGWGLGAYSFVGGGAGRIRSSLGDGARYFGEAGGGVNVGVIGVELSVKMAMNRLTEPVAHRFWTVPVALRGTLNF